jgi:5-methylcytosine-specific restriction protein A
MPTRPHAHNLAKPTAQAKAAYKRQRAKRSDTMRGTAHERGYDARWRKAARAYLNEHPLCVACEQSGRLTAAGVVDHLVPHRGGKGLFWDQANWQSLCKACHDQKTGRGE